MKDLKQYLGTLHKNFRRSVFEIKAPRIIKSKRMAENLSSSRIFDAPSRMKRKIHRESLAGIMLQHCGLIVDAFDLHFFFFFFYHTRGDADSRLRLAIQCFQVGRNLKNKISRNLQD